MIVSARCRRGDRNAARTESLAVARARFLHFAPPSAEGIEVGRQREVVDRGVGDELCGLRVHAFP